MAASVSSTETTTSSGLPPPVDTVEDGLRNLEQYGVNIHRDYISPETVARLRARANEQADMERQLGVAKIGGAGGPQELLDCPPGDATPHVYQIVEFLANKGRVFMDLIMHEQGRAYAQGMFGRLPYRLWSSGAIISRRGLARQMVHRDEGALPPEMCVRSTLLNIFVFLTESEAEMGATLIAPGSHLFKQPPWIADTSGVAFFPAIARPGDAVMWEGRTWHAGGEHRSDRTREVVTVGYSLAGVTPQHLYPAILHDDVYATLSVPELEMLGFRAEGAGYTNRIGPRNPGDTWSNTNRSEPYVPELKRGG